MTYTIEFSSEAQAQLSKWKRSNPRSFRKLRELLPELESHPRSGRGHPEALRGGNGVIWSRRLSGHDRLIYEIYDDVVTVTIITMGGHYDDK